MKKGITTIPEGVVGGGNFIKNIRLMDDQESCKIRFITDGDEFLYEYFHRLLEPNTGKFKGMKICVDSAFEQACSLCEAGAPRLIQFLAWVWEYSHDYTNPVQFKQPKSFTKVKVGGRDIFREEVKEPRLLRMAKAHKAAIVLKYERNGTLLDRDYELIRSGVAGSTRPAYMLEQLDITPMSNEIIDVAKNLPDLEDVAIDKVTTLVGEPQVFTTTNKTNPEWMEGLDEEENPF